ncbi:hypothetical protein ECFRIK1996_1191 [Escherichia coli FRIK1996]|nr:hypothetical protein ECFRIK1996_1191 [Escherichia coli FRIK1996]EKH31184.1 hypothetical protein ECFRIK1997_6198 [Escherichia coli FRIK1997]
MSISPYAFFSDCTYMVYCHIYHVGNDVFLHQSVCILLDWWRFFILIY